MTTTETDIFETLSQTVSSDPAQMLDQMVEHFRATRSAMEFFEAQKMRIRHRLGMALIPGEDDVARPEEVERQLEAGLLDACIETGSMLIEDGRIGDGWMYLRPTGDTEIARKLLDNIEIGDENYDEMIQVLLHEGVDVRRGYQAVLDHQGTCNSITLYEQGIVNRSKKDRVAAAQCLLDHLYEELLTLVRRDVVQREETVSDDETLGDLIEKHRWIMADGGYHLDTTHVAATVRVAAILDDPKDIKKARELCQYGRRLDHQFQYPGEEPFLDFYPAHFTFFSILLGENVEAGLKVFERKARTVNVAEHGAAAIETYIDLLDRVGQHRRAIDIATELVPNEIPCQQIVPRLIEIAASARKAGDDSAIEPILQYCRKHNDLLGYAAVLESASHV